MNYRSESFHKVQKEIFIKNKNRNKIRNDEINLLNCKKICQIFFFVLEFIKRSFRMRIRLFFLNT
jgi:hypothetical protein